jgi:type I restriction enzyme, S subunit
VDPNGWTAVALGDILTERRERVSVDPDAVYPIAGVYGFGRGVLMREPVRGDEISAAALYRITAGQVIYSRLKAFEGAFAVVPPEATGRFVSNEFPTFDVDERRATAAFIALVLSAPTTWRELTERIVGVGARRERLQVVDFLEYEVELPPLNEQRGIVELAGAAARAAEAAREEEEAVATTMRAAAEAYVGAGEPEPTPLGDVLIGLRTGDSPRCEARPPGADEWGVLKLSAIQPGVFDASSTKALPADAAYSADSVLHGGEVLMTRSNTLPRVGACCRVPMDVRERLIYPDLVFRLEPDTERVNPGYLVAALGVSTSRAQIEEAATGTSDSMKKISAAVIRQIELALPPIEDQHRIAAMLESFRKTRLQAQLAADAATRVRSVLVDSLLSGQRRVRT